MSMITFAANVDMFRKRKRVHKACDDCKRRRKRCTHAFDETEDPVIDPTNSKHSETPRAISRHPTPQREPTPIEHDRNGKDTPPQINESSDLEHEPARFVGFLSPEAVLRGQAREYRGTAASPAPNDCGHWVNSNDTDGDQNSGEDTTPLSSKIPDGVGPKDNPIARNLLKAYLDAIGVHVLPPQRDQDILVGIYFEFIHPILPIVDEYVFRKYRNQPKESRVLLQAICLIASKHDLARQHLFLGNTSQLLPPREFAKRLFSSVTAALEAKLESDRITLIQVQALLSLHCEGFDGAEQASMHLSQAIHHAHTIGLQFGCKRNPRDHYLETLFWCLWSLDKVNACINGRPLIMHDRDSHIPKPTEKERTAFGIWLLLAEALDKIICYYRPGFAHSETGWEEDFPSFEDVIGDGGDSFSGPVLATLELFYHAVSITSHKSLTIHSPVRATPSFTRQSLSAVRVVSILKEEAPDNLPPLPIIPYSLSLAASVAYRRFRQSKLQTHKNRGKEDLKRCCQLLERLRRAWWSAGAMADLGKAALSKADKCTTGAQRTESGVASSMRTAVSAASRNDGPDTANGMEYPPPMSHATPTAQPLEDPGGPFTPSNYQHLQSSLSIEGSNNMTDLSTNIAFTDSPDWLNFDNAFENMDTLLGSSGADLSSELLRPFNYDFGMEGFLDR